MKAILVHGGAGSRKAGKAQLSAIARALDVGYDVLKKKKSSLEAVEEAIRVLEDSGQFNAGLGSALQLDGKARMDAALMGGEALAAGAVASIEKVKNPISAARLVLEKTPHVLMAGQHATRLAEAFRLPMGRHPFPEGVKKLRSTLKSGEPAVRFYRSVYGGETVGAVALDEQGNLAAGTSTGGISAMLPGRIGDSPLIGCGLYADNRAGAVSATGIGEGIIRVVLAKEICHRLEEGISPTVAARRALQTVIRRVKGSAGVIVLTVRGEFALMHTTTFLCAGYKTRGKTAVSSHFTKVLSL